jgi:hypothetical protein
MTPAEIVTALVRHGTRIAVEGERVRLVFNGSAPPDDLIRAAREAKAALREIVESGPLANGPNRWHASILSDHRPIFLTRGGGGSSMIVAGFWIAAGRGGLPRSDGGRTNCSGAIARSPLLVSHAKGCCGCSTAAHC